MTVQPHGLTLKRTMAKLGEEQADLEQQIESAGAWDLQLRDY